MQHDHPFRDYAGSRVTVMGLGSFGGGVGAVRFLVDRGACVTVTDLRSEDQLSETLSSLRDVAVSRWRLGRHEPEDFISADLVVVNPAVKRSHPLLQQCLEHNIPLTSEMNLFWQHCPAKIAAVTGSNGKSTTTALLASILEQSGQKVWLGGNLGRSLLPVVDQIQPCDRVVLELSSFQLADLDRLQVSPHVSVVTNLAPNHLDWHATFDDYRGAKQTMLRWQTAEDVAVLNEDDPDVRQWTCRGERMGFGLEHVSGEGAFLSGDEGVLQWAGQQRRFPLRKWLQLPGKHNVANALAALTAATAMRASLEFIQNGIERYQPLPHRLQFVAEVAGRRFYNDSLATTPESALVALAAFQQPIVLLAGGYDKQVDLAEMAAGIARSTKAVALMGQTAASLAKQIGLSAECHTTASAPLPNFATAFEWAWAQSAPGDVILLSPGCASYDWFRHFADRGQQFQQLVQQKLATHQACGL